MVVCSGLSFAVMSRGYANTYIDVGGFLLRETWYTVPGTLSGAVHASPRASATCGATRSALGLSTAAVISEKGLCHLSAMLGIICLITSILANFAN